MENSNKLIAEFMGFTQEKNIGWYDNDMLMSQNVYDTNNGNCFDELLFDQSWDWLMPVVVKLFDDEYNEFDGVGDLSFRLNDTLLETNLDSLYSIVVEFIKNQNN
tara:strand:- start:252 stop:566 length:315 start_codon:yes stop_codon:yes gene_type:complete